MEDKNLLNEPPKDISDCNGSQNQSIDFNGNPAQKHCTENNYDEDADFDLGLYVVLDEPDLNPQKDESKPPDLSSFQDAEDGLPF